MSQGKMATSQVNLLLIKKKKKKEKKKNQVTKAEQNLQRTLHNCGKKISQGSLNEPQK